MAQVTIGGRTYEVEVRGKVVVVDGHEFPVNVKDDGEHLTVTAGTVPYRVQLPSEGERASGMGLQVDYRPFTYEYSGPLGGTAPAPRKAATSASANSSPKLAAKGTVVAQIAGHVTKVLVSVGDRVKAGDVLLLLEAMKMENEIKAGADGTVKELPASEGQRVTEGEALAVIE